MCIELGYAASIFDKILVALPMGGSCSPDFWETVPRIIPDNYPEILPKSALLNYQIVTK